MAITYLLYKNRSYRNIIIKQEQELHKEKQKKKIIYKKDYSHLSGLDHRNTGRESARRYDLVTVLFSDIQGFTKIAEQMNPEALVDELDNFFYHFDMVVEKYNIEKIKTIGDAYMCAGGIPNQNRTNPVEVVLSALEIQRFMLNLKKEKNKIWDLRIGIHTGSVIAGIVGHKKLSYDIWGDTVNTASRMESSGRAGKINISGQTYEFVKDYFICEYRGKMPVKYKGDIDMYFILGIKPELSNKYGNPNAEFMIKLQLLRIFDLEEFIFNLLEEKLPGHLYFHNLRNTIDFYIHAELFGRAEELKENELLILKTAGLLYNTGFIFSYHNHYTESIRFAHDILPEYHYSGDQIEKICNLISRCYMSEKTETKLERIMQDAKHAYIGRVDFLEIMKNMYRELAHFNLVNDFQTWKKQQMDVIRNYQFHTQAALTLREVDINDQLKELEKLHDLN